jgi:hypothetical protein
MDSIAASGSQLVQASFGAMEASAARLSRGDFSRMVEDVVTFKRGEHGVRIGAALLRAADETTGTLLDVLA